MNPLTVRDLIFMLTSLHPYTPIDFVISNKRLVNDCLWTSKEFNIRDIRYDATIAMTEVDCNDKIGSITYTRKRVENIKMELRNA